MHRLQFYVLDNIADATMVTCRRTSDLFDTNLLLAVGSNSSQPWRYLGMEYVNNAKTFANNRYSWIEKTKKLSVQELINN